MNKQIKFEIRPVEFVRIENFSDFSSRGYSIQELVFITKNNNDDSYFDYGALCYSKRTQTNKFSHFAKVDKSTFHPEMAKALKNYLSDQYLSLAVKGAVTKLSRVRSTVNDLYELSQKYGIELKFNDINQCHLIYEKYTSLLVDQVRKGLSNPNFLSSETYANKQQVCFGLIAANCDLSGKAFKELYTEIKYFSATTKEQKVHSDLEYSIFLSHCKKLYYNLANFTINKKDFPIIIDIEDDKNNIYIYDYMIKTPGGEQTKYFIDSQSRRFLSRIEAVESAKRINNVSELPIRFKKTEEDLPYNLKQSYNRYANSILKANRLDSRERLKVINLAITSFALWLIMDSGCNLSAIFQLKESVLDDLKNDTTNHKLIDSELSSNKARSRDKDVNIPITKKIVEGLKDYLSFRNYILDFYGEEVKNLVKDALFFGFTLEKGKTNRDIVSPLGTKDILNFKIWYSSIFGKEALVNPKDGRRSNGNIVQNVEDGIVVAAERLGHTEEVNIKHYTEATKEQTHAQLTEFFDEVYGQMIFSNRNTDKLIPVVTDVESNSTIAGHCISALPIRAEGFNENIESPNCSNPASCIFCEHYVLHTDDIDIRKLLSLRKIAELHPDQNAEMQIVKYRVDEIFKYIVDQNGQLISLISLIKEEVDDGYLDEHWESLMELFADLGVDFYV